MSDRRSAEASLRGNELFQSLAGTALVGFYFTDASGACIYTNARWQEITGRRFEEALGDGWIHAVHPDDRDAVAASLARCTRDGADFDEELRVLRPSGEVRWVRSKATAVHAASSGELLGFAGTVEDVTERRLAEEMRRDFVAMLSHDLRSPISTIIGIARILRGRSRGAEESLLLDTIESSARKADGLALDLVNYEQVERGLFVAHRRETDLESLVSDVAADVASSARLTDVAIAADVAPGTPAVRIDRSLVERALTNLARNALSVSPAESTVRIAAAVEGEVVRFTVADRGPGIAESQRARLFTKFSVLHGERRHGAGLGLFIVRSVAEAHGGGVAVECPPSGGSVFTMTLSLAADPE